MEELIHCVIFILMFKGSSIFYPWSFWINRFRCGRWQQFALYSASDSASNESADGGFWEPGYAS